MTDTPRAEAHIDVNGRTYTLQLSMNAAAALETRRQTTIGALLTDASALNFVAIRSMVFMLLQKHHAKQFTNEEQAGDFIDDAGGVSAMLTAMARLAEPTRAAPAQEP